MRAGVASDGGGGVYSGHGPRRFQENRFPREWRGTVGRKRPLVRVRPPVRRPSPPFPAVRVREHDTADIVSDG